MYNGHFGSPLSRNQSNDKGKISQTIIMFSTMSFGYMDLMCILLIIFVNLNVIYVIVFGLTM